MWPVFRSQAVEGIWGQKHNHVSAETSWPKVTVCRSMSSMFVGNQHYVMMASGFLCSGAHKIYFVISFPASMVIYVFEQSKDKP